jgi:hypothetical protein
MAKLQPDRKLSSPKSSGTLWAVVAIALIFGVHSFQAIRLFPSLESIVARDSPVLVVDHAIHEDHGAMGARFLRESGRTWGYDPFFMAGYPETPVWDSSSHPGTPAIAVTRWACSFRRFCFWRRSRSGLGLWD